MLMGLIVLTVMVGLQAVGVVLIAAMLITPAVAARFWSERLGTMVVVSTAFGGISGVVGTFVSSLAPRIPTGPVMVLVATLFFVVSALCAPRRGMLARWRRHRHNAERERRHHFLRAFIELSNKESRNTLPASLLAVELGWKVSRVGTDATGAEDTLDAVTDSGILRIEVLKKGFLWLSRTVFGHYLYYRSILDADHVDRPADEVEHLLTPEIIADLEQILAEERGIDPDEVVNIHEHQSLSPRGARVMQTIVRSGLS